METPDGKKFDVPKPASSGGERRKAVLNWIVRGGKQGLQAAGALAMVVLRAAGALTMVVLRAIGKFIITIWRLASALDSALWRAVKLFARRFWAASLHGLQLAGQVLRSFILWLPTRTGRAYSAFSGIAIVICALWIIDLLRESPVLIDSATGRERAPIDTEDPILARIEGRYVHLSEIEAATKASGLLKPEDRLTPRGAFDRGLVESYVEQRLLARAAQEDGLHRSATVRRRVNAARDRILAASLLQARIKEAITPEKVEQYYQAQRDVADLGSEVRARHILVETGEEAEEIVAQLASGADFGALARERSLDRATAPLGGEIGWFIRPMMERTLSSAAFATPTGEIAPPFQTEFGWHVLEVQGRRRQNAKTFDELRDQIQDFLRNRLIADLLAELEEQNQVIYYYPEDDEPRTISPLLTAPEDTAQEISASDVGE